MARLSSHRRKRTNPGREVFAVSTRASRDGMTVPEQGYERKEIAPFVEIQPAPRPSDEQGVGKTPGLTDWPWSRVFQSLVPKRGRMTAGSGNAPNVLLTPPRPERSGWGTDYLLYFEQQNRHVWPGGFGMPMGVIEHPTTVPLTSLAPRR